MRKVSIRIQIMLWYTLLTAVLLAAALPILSNFIETFLVKNLYKNRKI